MAPIPARRALVAISAFGSLLAIALTAGPASAGASGASHKAPLRADRADGRVDAACCATAGIERPSSARRLSLQALAREQWLRAVQASQGGPAAAARAAADIRSAVVGAKHLRPGVLTGVVRGADGNPVAGACVTATGPSGSTTRRSRGDGRYLLAGLPTGNYSLRVSDCAGAPRSGSLSPSMAVWPGLPARVWLGSGQVRTLPPATMLSADGSTAVARAGAGARRAGTGSISGRITGHGHPLQGVCAAAWRVGGGSGSSAATSKAGRYKITNLQPGRYQVQFAGDSFCGNNKGNWLSQWYPGITTPFLTAKAAVIRVKAGQIKTGINASLKLGSQIGGTVRAKSGSPLPGICVNIQGRVPGGFVGYGFPSGRGGRYELHALFPGRYTVQFSIGCGNKGNYAPQWWRLKSSARQATPIKITRPQIVAHVDAALEPGAAISGTVRALNTSGKRLARVCVSTASRQGDSAEALTGRDGTYHLKGLFGGRYVVVFDPTCFGSFSSNYLPAHRATSVKPRHTRRGVNAVLQPGAGLTGVVTGPHGNPLAGICVQISGRHGDAFGETGFDGSYSITGQPAGEYIVQFAGCDNRGSVAPQFYNNEPSEASADPVTLTAGAITTGIDAAMRPGATITGTVTDAAGHRLTGVCVGVADESLLFFGYVFNDIEFTSGGHYRVVNLAPGPYQVDFGCGGGRYQDQWYQTKTGAYASSLLSIPAGITNGINAVLHPGAAISGVVTDKAGHRLSNACLYLVDAKTGAQVVASVFAGGVTHGRYKITGLSPGAYKVFFYGCGSKYASQWYRGRSTERNADPVRVRARRTTAGIDAALGVGGTISGRVVDRATGNPVRNVCVEAFDNATQAFGFALTDKTGRYAMRGMATGRYSMSFTPCYAKGPNLASLTRLRLVRVIAPHAATGINARLSAGGSVSGAVTGSSHPQTGTCVELFPLSATGTFGFAQTSSDGRYTATSLAAGQYQAFFNDPTCLFGTSQFAAQWYNGQPTQASADTMTVTAGNTTSGIDAALQPFGEITGTVTGPTHAPVAGECATAVPIGKDAAFFFLPEFAITSATGSYSLPDLQPGRYKVKFSVGCGDSGFATQWWNNASSRASATVITVGAGTVVTGINAAVKH